MFAELLLANERAREVIHRGPRRTVGRFASVKMGRMVHWESQLERDLIYQLEFDRRVLVYQEQPLSVKLRVDGRPRKYTPDLLIRRADSYDIIEVKPADTAGKPEWQALFGAAREHFAGLGANFCVVTDAEIRVQPRLANIVMLLRHQRTTVDGSVRNAVIHWLRNGAIPLAIIEAELSALNAGIREIWALACAGDIQLGLDSVIGLDSLISLPGR
jgi:hypothetical protein